MKAGLPPSRSASTSGPGLRSLLLGTRWWMWGGGILLIFGIAWFTAASSRPPLPAARGAAASAEELWEGEKVVPLSWDDLLGLDPFTGKKSAQLQALEGRLVKIPGHLVPLDDDYRKPSEFLLVPYMGACVHMPAPEANQMVYVQMEEGRQIEHDPWSWEGMWIVGQLEIESFDSPYGAVGFRMGGLASQTYDWNEG